MLRMHSTQPRMASLDSWDRTRSQMWRSAVPRCVAPVERLLLRNCTTDPASLLPRSLITRDRSKMNTGILPDCGAQRRRRRNGEGCLTEEMKSPVALSHTHMLSLFLSLSLRNDRAERRGILSVSVKTSPLEPKQKICSDKERGVMKSTGSQLMLCEVM